MNHEDIDFKSVDILDFMWKYRNDPITYGESLIKSITFDYLIDDQNDAIGYDLVIKLKSSKYLRYNVTVLAKMDRNFNRDTIEITKAVYNEERAFNQNIQIKDTEDELRIRNFVRFLFIEKYIKTSNFSKYDTVKIEDGVKVVNYSPIYIDKILYKGFKNMSTLEDLFNRAKNYGIIKLINLEFVMNIGTSCITRHITSKEITNNIVNSIQDIIRTIREGKYKISIDQEPMTIKEYYKSKGISLSNDQIDKILSRLILDLEDDRNTKELNKIFNALSDFYVNWTGSFVYNNNDYLSNTVTNSLDFITLNSWVYIPVTPSLPAKEGDIEIS